MANFRMTDDLNTYLTKFGKLSQSYYADGFITPQMANDAPRVFVSYSNDSREHADRVLALANRLRRDGIDTIRDHYETSPPEGWTRWMVRQIETADFVLMIFNETYEKRLSGKEAQGRRPRNIERAAPASCCLGRHATCSPDRRSTAVPLLCGVVAAARFLGTDASSEGRRALRDHRGSAQIALQGMGGIGKSVLAAALCHSSAVRERFVDGVIWLRLGQSPNLERRQLGLHGCFEAAPAQFEDLESGRLALSMLLADRAVLVVLDDV
jgi:hypothetical protein